MLVHLITEPNHIYNLQKTILTFSQDNGPNQKIMGFSQTTV